MKLKCIRNLFMRITKERVFTSGKEYENISTSSNEWRFIDDRNIKHTVNKKDRDGWGQFFKPIRYIVKKLITGRALAADGACNDELRKFVELYGFDDCAITHFADVDEYAAQVKPINLEFLVKQGYLERIEPERTYHAGQRVRIEGNDHYWKVRTEKIILAALETDGSASPWRRPVKIEDPNQITQAEMDQMINPKDFRVGE